MSTPRTRLLMSALIYPGVGQFMQKRIFWGMVYSISFTIFFVGLCIITVRAVWNGILDPSTLRDSLISLKTPFALVVAIWLANIYDTWWADFSRSKRSGEAAPR